MSGRIAVAVLLAFTIMPAAALEESWGVSTGQQAANYYYGALAPIDQYAQAVTPRLINGAPYNGQFSASAMSYFGNPSGGFPNYIGPQNNYYGGPAANGPMGWGFGGFPGAGWHQGPANCTNNTAGGNGTNPCALARNSANGFGGRSVFSSCACTNVYNPVCSNQGVTYANWCRAECHGASSVTQGPCFSFNFDATCNTTCSCSDNVGLVCGVNKVTYENSCVAACAKVTVASNNACTLDCNCQYQYAPVCSKTGRNYVNLCLLNCAKESLLYRGPCSEYNPDNNPCSKCDDTLNPVCGMDGKTYPNACKLTCQNKTSIRYTGECPTYVNGTCTCTNTYLPVCSTDGTTFNNYCQLFCASKTFAYMGQCVSSTGASGFNAACLQNCASQGWNPLCGTDGLTYGNQCAMTCKLSGAVSPVKSGPCNPVVNGFCTCTPDINLVCGADGLTYLNPCQLNCVSVRQRSVGACEAIGNYGSVLAWFQQYGVGSNFVSPTGYSIMENPHVFIQGPYSPYGQRQRPRSAYNDDESSSGNGNRRRQNNKNNNDNESSGRGRRRPNVPVRPVIPRPPSSTIQTRTFSLIGQSNKD